MSDRLWCPDCRAVTSGDCGNHGPKTFTVGKVYPERPERSETESLRAQLQAAEQQVSVLQQELESERLSNDVYAKRIEALQQERNAMCAELTLVQGEAAELDARLTDLQEKQVAWRLGALTVAAQEPAECLPPQLPDVVNWDVPKENVDGNVRDE